MAILLKSACVTDLAAFPALVARSIVERSNSEIAVTRSSKRLPDRMPHRSRASGATHPLSYGAVTLVGSAPKQFGHQLSCRCRKPAGSDDGSNF
jgi:hypothetical protein